MYSGLWMCYLEGVSESGKLALRKTQHSQATHLFWASTAHHNIRRGKHWRICCVLSLTTLFKWQQTPGPPIKYMSLHQNKGLIERNNRPYCCSTNERKKTWEKVTCFMVCSTYLSRSWFWRGCWHSLRHDWMAVWLEVCSLLTFHPLSSWLKEPNLESTETWMY